MTEVRVDVQADGLWLGLAVSGEIDVANATVVENQILAPITNQLTAVSVDMSQVTYVDSTGMRILFALADRLHVMQIRLELVAPAGSPARRLIEQSGLTAMAWVRS